MAPAALAADVVVLAVRDRLSVLVIETSAGTRLPGGFVGPEESADLTARRKLIDKTGVGENLYLEQLASFSAPDRDPRGWIPTVAYVALVGPGTTPTDPAAAWVEAATAPPLAYDHDAILALAIDRIRGKLWWSNVAAGALEPSFSLAEARHVYEAIAQTSYDPSTFARDLRATGLIEPTGEERAQARGRPAALYRFSAHGLAWGAGRRKRVS